MAATLPHWDMTPIFPGLGSDELADATREAVAGIAALRAHFDRHGIRRLQAPLALDAAEVALFEDTLARLNALLERTRTLGAYLGAFVSTDSRDEVAEAKQSILQRQTVELSKLGTRFEAWVGSLDVEALVARSAAARDHAFALRKASLGAKHQMSEPEEDLAAMLSLSGGQAWVKLHGTVSSRLTATVRLPDGSAKELPMSAVRGLAYDPDPAVRRAAYDAELAGWRSVAAPLAAALNGVTGEVTTVNVRRGWSDPLDRALFNATIDRPTLEAMHAAAAEAFPDFRRYLRAKARLLGAIALPWWDLFAPVGADGRTWDYPAATAYIVDRFATFSKRLSGLAKRAFDEGWVDAEPRVGKRDGAFCMGIRRDESRVFLNFNPSYKSMQTLAHELGHAYHNLNLVSRTPLQRQTPMTLAETASIFDETIITNAALAGAPDAERLAILDDTLENATQVVVDIHSRFLFEQRVFARRAERELSARELDELMLGAQRETYGDGLDETTLHPMMWAMKPHYYSTGRSFYNFPYTFGLLYGLGLYARYREAPDRFLEGYDDFLSSTGLDDAAGLAARFGIDIRDVAFWRSSLDVVRERIAAFELLAGSR